MSFVNQSWKFLQKPNGNFWIYPGEINDNGEFIFAAKKIAEVFSDGTEDADAIQHARLISASPEMRIALINAVEALRTTEIFMCGQGLETGDLKKIVRTIDELLNRVDGGQEDYNYGRLERSFSFFGYRRN